MSKHDLDFPIVADIANALAQLGEDIHRDNRALVARDDNLCRSVRLFDCSNNPATKFNRWVIWRCGRGPGRIVFPASGHTGQSVSERLGKPVVDRVWGRLPV